MTTDYKGEFYKTAEYWTDFQLQEQAAEEAGWASKMHYGSGPKPQPKPRRVWGEDEIRILIQTNDTVLYRALIRLYNCQTADEKSSQETRNKNGAGFNSFDAKFLTSVAEFLQDRGFLTAGQKAVTRRKLAKYTKQLTRIANA